MYNIESHLYVVHELDTVFEAGTKRGTAVLVITLIAVSSFVVLISIPSDQEELELGVRVCVVDSGITKNAFLQARVVAERSFVDARLGYLATDNSTDDSRPLGVLHGTYVASIIATNHPTAAIVNAKVVSQQNSATIGGIVNAIHWAVTDANCSVINLSLGTAPIGDPLLRNTISWAFGQGVTIIAAVGNNGQSGVSGSSIESPAIYPEVIAVAAVDEQGDPYSFSGRGPLRNREVKPDISSIGRYSANGRTLFGTSFATPIVSAGASRIIEYCEARGWSWTPGMVKAVLMSSASYLPFESWEVGAGLLDVDRAITQLSSVQRTNEIPQVGVSHPNSGPYSFERWLSNSTVEILVSIFCSTNATFAVSYGGTEASWVLGPSEIHINQSGCFAIKIVIPPDTIQDGCTCTVTMVALGYRYLRSRFVFSVSIPLAKVAFDVSHSPWRIDSIYGQFREAYSLLTSAGIAVEEIYDRANLTLDHLRNYDAVFILDPCAWGTKLWSNSVVLDSVFTYTASEIGAIWDYWASGGNLLISGVTNQSLDLVSVNQLLVMFGLHMNFDQIPVTTITINGVASTELVTGIHEHQVTRGIDSFDFNGCSLNYSGNAFELAWAEVNYLDEFDNIQTENRTLLVGMEQSPSGSRMIVSGTNFFLDNWGIRGLYRSTENSRLLLQIAYWLTRLA
ncbi:MAG: hypothetical protein EAX95_09060 [Candidatus Thorarchaeota archaeon]|nr:hypothetical protein [Candidatus Thorarchaeota archaeon]